MVLTTAATRPATSSRNWADCDRTRWTELREMFVVKSGFACGFERPGLGSRCVVVSLDRVVEVLLSLGADPNQAADEGRTPLPLAVLHQFNARVTDLLLDAGARQEGKVDVVDWLESLEQEGPTAGRAAPEFSTMSRPPNAVS